MSHFDMPLQPHEKLPPSWRVALWIFFTFLFCSLGRLIWKALS